MSALRGVLEFLDEIGLYDVILPFMLIFATVYAILEKTKIFGVEKIDDQEVTRKNLNAIVAFAIAFIGVASSKVVSIINKSVGSAVLLIIAGLCFLLMIGLFFGEKEDMFKFLGKNRWIAIIIMFIAIILIFMNSITTAAGNTWLEVFWMWISGGAISDSAVGAVIFLIAIAIFMAWVTKPEKGGKTTSKKNEESENE